MHRGYVKLWRCIEDTGLVGQPTAFYLYSYLLLKATHKAKSVVVSGAVFNIDAGQIVIGRNKLADETGLSVQKVRTALELLKKLSIITCKSTNKCTVVSLVNWDIYQNNKPAHNQQDNQQSTSAQPAPNQHLTTIQECKNIDNNTPSEEGVVAAVPGAAPHAHAREKKTTNGNGCPPCPHQAIVDAYHELLPELPKVKVWSGQRQSHLQARWREGYARKCYATQAEGIDYWRRYFGYVKKMDWLMGRCSGRDGRPSFRADLAWLVRPDNFAKVVEGRYEKREEA